MFVIVNMLQIIAINVLFFTHMIRVFLFEICLLITCSIKCTTIIIIFLLIITKFTCHYISYILQSDISSVQGLWAANNMKLNIINPRKSDRLIYVYKLCQSCTKRIDSVRDLIIQDLDFISIIMLTIYILSVLSCLDLVLSVTFSFSSVECLYTFCYTLIEPKLEYASLVWNSIMSTDADKLESTQQKLAALY
jgi:hypothetical protein